MYVYCINSCLRLFNYFVLSFDIIHSLSRVERFCYIHIISEKNILTRILSIWEISRCECVRNLTQIYSQCFDRHYFKSCSNFKLWLHILFVTFNKGVLKTRRMWVQSHSNSPTQVKVDIRLNQSGKAMFEDTITWRNMDERASYQRSKFTGTLCANRGVYVGFNGLPYLPIL